MFDMPKNLPKGVKHQISKAELAHARAVEDKHTAERQSRRERRDATIKIAQVDPRQWPLKHQVALLIAMVLGMVVALGWGGISWRAVSRCMDYGGYDCGWTMFSVVWWAFLGLSIGGSVIYIVHLMQTEQQTAESPPSDLVLSPLNDLVFKSGKDAIEYVQAHMQTEWTKNRLVVGLLGHPILENGILSTEVLIPKGNIFVSLPTHTHINAVSSPNSSEILVNGSSNILLLDLKFGDLVSVFLAGQDPKLRELYPETDGWAAFVVAKNSLTYSLREAGWILEKRYRLQR